MVLVDFYCDMCDRYYNDIAFNINDYKSYTCSCGSAARRIYSVRAPNYGFKPYWSDQLSPEPCQKVYIDSRATKHKLMKKYGLVESGRYYGKHWQPVRGDQNGQP